MRPVPDFADPCHWPKPLLQRQCRHGCKPTLPLGCALGCSVLKPSDHQVLVPIGFLSELDSRAQTSMSPKFLVWVRSECVKPEKPRRAATRRWQRWVPRALLRVQWACHATANVGYAAERI